MLLTNSRPYFFIAASLRILPTKLRTLCEKYVQIISQLKGCSLNSQQIAYDSFSLIFEEKQKLFGVRFIEGV